MTLYKTISPQRPTLADTLATFTSTFPPLESLLDSLHRLQPRYYSISNSPMTSPQHAKIAFNIVDYELDVGPGNSKRVRGLCTPWLDALCSSSALGSTLSIPIPIFPKPENTFELDMSLETPLILVGAGTGIAPLIGFLDHLSASGKNVQTALFYGHRFNEGDQEDTLYSKEIQTFIESGVLTHFVECLSRSETPEYVHTALSSHKSLLWDWIHSQKGRVYVCGSVAMSKNVHGALCALASEQLQGNAMQGIEYWNGLAEEKRYLRDLWG